MKGFMFFRLKLFGRLRRLLFRIGLRRIPGARRLYHLLYNNLIKPKGIASALLNIQGNKMYIDGAAGTIGAELLVEGVYEKYETELFKKMAQDGMVVVDIGANIGYYTLIAAKLVGDKGVVYAFEPEPRSYKLLCQNIAINGYTNIVPIEKAVSKTNGKTKFYVGAAITDISSFAEDNVLQYSKNLDCLEVETITLDDFFERTAGDDRIDLMKIDVEGAEELVVDGAERILRSNTLKIFMEFVPRQLRNVGTDPLELLYKLRNYGFEIKLLNGRKQVLEPIENIEEFCRTLESRRKSKSGEVFNLLLEK
ncbi:MAG: FkbM family methyltransferase [Dehalococcoidia bacterium]|nr:FkbM family methyltransferase [Dehalococcoidia bacterium]